MEQKFDFPEFIYLYLFIYEMYVPPISLSKDNFFIILMFCKIQAMFFFYFFSFQSQQQMYIKVWVFGQDSGIKMDELVAVVVIYCLQLIAELVMILHSRLLFTREIIE